MNVAEFIAKWRKVELKERSAAQEHFIDLCGVVSHKTPADGNPTDDQILERLLTLNKARSAGAGED